MIAPGNAFGLTGRARGFKRLFDGCLFHPEEQSNEHNPGDHHNGGDPKPPHPEVAPVCIQIRPETAPRNESRVIPRRSPKMGEPRMTVPDDAHRSKGQWQKEPGWECG